MTQLFRGLVILVWLVTPIASWADVRREAVSAEFIHHRIWVTPVLQGRTLRFFTDTGGGWNAIAKSTVRRLALKPISDNSVEVVDWPVFDNAHAVPAPSPHFRAGRLQVAPDEILWGDGTLGGRWHADAVWEFDYPGKRLSRLRGFRADDDDPHRVSLGFQRNAAGQRTMHFPSIDVTVDGETLALLYDSGASATVTEGSAEEFGVAAGTEIGTSFIEPAVLDRWISAHPDWRVLQKAAQLGRSRLRMIEVPEIVLGGHRVGPVWFAERFAGAFTVDMSVMMDRPVHGALGGSALRHFRVVLDYPGAVAYFHRDGIDQTAR